LLAEQPLLLSILLGAVSASLIYAWLQTGKKPAAVGGVIVALLIPVAWIVASQWHTDREAIEALIHKIADAVERNDVDTAVQIIGDPATQARARMELSKYVFDMAAVNRIRSIDIIDGAVPLEADVDMSVKIDVSSRSGQLRNIRVLRRLLLRFEKTDDSWVVTDYRHMPITGQPDQYSNLSDPSSRP
jgi:ketosteroid isomerase-like protein